MKADQVGVLLQDGGGGVEGVFTAPVRGNRGGNLVR
jgi:hypothetical protein